MHREYLQLTTNIRKKSFLLYIPRNIWIDLGRTLKNAEKILHENRISLKVFFKND